MDGIVCQRLNAAINAYFFLTVAVFRRQINSVVLEDKKRDKIRFNMTKSIKARFRFKFVTSNYEARLFRGIAF